MRVPAGVPPGEYGGAGSTRGTSSPSPGLPGEPGERLLHLHGQLARRGDDERLGAVPAAAVAAPHLLAVGDAAFQAQLAHGIKPGLHEAGIGGGVNATTVFGEERALGDAVEAGEQGQAGIEHLAHDMAVPR